MTQGQATYKDRLPTFSLVISVYVARAPSAMTDLIIESKGYFQSTTPQDFGSQYITETFIPQEQATALTVDNVLRAVENVKNWKDLGQRLRVPRSKVVEIDKLYSTDKDKMKAVVEYWWRVDPSPSWRMVIRALDWADETDAADRIKPNAERLADDSLDLNSVIRALAKVKDWDSFGQTLGVVYSRRKVIRERYSSEDYRKEATWSYWLQYMPEVSWNKLASRLYYKEEFTALQAVLPYVYKTTERTLTLSNLCKVLEAVRDWKRFGRCLFIPKSKLDEISKQYSDPDQCKQEMIKEWLCINSTPSWIAVAEALFRWGLKESDLHGSPLRTVMTYARGVTPVSPTLPTLLPHHRRDPRFPGIIFYGDPILKMVGSDGCKLAWPEIGICLHFPPNAVPDGKALHLTIWPCLSGPFVPPEGREFSSPVYLISPAFHFQEDVELSINHFENLRCQEDVASMSFATTLSSKEIHTSKPVYTFESLGKGDFKVTSSVGTINLRHFCRNEFCQVAATRKRQRCSQDDEPEAERTTKRSKEEHSYCVQLHQSTSPQHPSYAVFAVSLYQELYLSNLASNLICQFPDHHFRMQPKQPVYISGDAVELEIRQVEGWSMIPSILPAKISPKEVDLALFDPNCKVLSASYPPKFHVTIKPGAQATDTVCVLPVRGLQEELSFPMALSLSARSPYAMHEHSQGMTADANTSMNKGRTTKMLLTINDRTKVMKYLRRISSVQTLLMVGEFLGVDGRKFAKNKTADTFLFDLVGDWLSRTYKVDEKGIPSWRKLMEVLEEVDEMGLANDIRKDLGLAVPLPAAPAAPAALEVSKAVQTDGEREVQTEPWSTTKHFLYSLPGSAYRLLKGVPLLLLIVALSLFIILIIIQAFNDHADYCPSD